MGGKIGVVISRPISVLPLPGMILCSF